ncbi:MAG: molybdopterin-guanine dinucleotide biosynthesis protein B [Anaerolineae bacterium]
MVDKVQSPAVLGISGWHNSGKTALVEALVAALRAEGLRVCTVKHAVRGFDVDEPGSDSWRMWEAGADAVVVVGPDQLLIRERRTQPSLSDTLARLEGRYDVVLVEGFKRERLPRVVIQVAGTEPLPEADAMYVVHVGEQGLQRESDAFASAVEAGVAWVRRQRFV